MKDRGKGQARACGDCSLCCRVLRVDELKKLGGLPCVHQDAPKPGCAIHPTRPSICRAYRCLWLSGGLEVADRPDKLGAVLDVVAQGPVIRLEIRQGRAGVFDESERLQAIADEYRTSMPVRVTDVDEVLDPDRAFRLLLPTGEEHRVEGEWTEIHSPGGGVERKRLPFLERRIRRLFLLLQRIRFRARKVRIPG